MFNRVKRAVAWYVKKGAEAYSWSANVNVRL